MFTFPRDCVNKFHIYLKLEDFVNLQFSFYYQILILVSFLGCKHSFSPLRNWKTLWITKKVGTAIPIICTAAFGLMGRDAATNSFKEIPQWGQEEEEDYFNNWQFYDPSAFADGDFSEIFDRPKTNRNAAVMLMVGFLPGMEVASVTLSQSKKDALFVDEFVTNIRECSAIASGCTSLAAIMLFIGLGTDTDGLLEKLDCAMSPETAIIGDGSSVFLCGGNYIQKNS